VPDIILVPGLKAYRAAVELYITDLLTPNYTHGKHVLNE